MDREIRVRCNKPFKDDVESFASAQNMNMSEYTREALRQQMQRDMANRGDNNE